MRNTIAHCRSFTCSRGFVSALRGGKATSNCMTARAGISTTGKCLESPGPKAPGRARAKKPWMRAVWREGITPLLQMHDALECSVSSPEQAECVAQLGCEAVALEVPIRVDLKYGRNWGDAKHAWAELQQNKPALKQPSGQMPAPAKVNGHAAATPAATSTLIVPKQEEPETLEQRLARIALADLIGEQPINGKISCPFHEDDTPSLHVYRDHYHCFGCGAHGG